MDPRCYPCPQAGLALGVLLLLASGASVLAEDPPWLRHPDPVLRALAAFELRRHAEDGTVARLVEGLGREEDPLVLACLLGSLEGRARLDLVAEGGPLLPGLLLRQVAHPFPPVRERAWAVLKRLPAGAAPGGEDEEVWHRWWLASRKGIEATRQKVLAARRAAAEARDRSDPAPSETTPEEEDDLFDHVERLRRDGLDLVIVMDHTGSMASVIGAARARAASWVRRLSWLVPRFRAGLVTYDDGARFRIELTSNAKALKKAFGKVGAGGGADWEEGVDKGIALALRQDRMGWGRRAWRVIVVIGDAPPHGADVEGLLRRIRSARDDVLYEHPVVLHTVSTTSMGVEHFGEIAEAGGGAHVTLSNAGGLEEELVALAFGAAWRDRVRPWLAEISSLRRALRKAGG